MTAETFLTRWSRLKRHAHDTQPVPSAETDTAAPLDGGEPPVSVTETPPPLTLADAHALTADADFRPFLRADVDPEVHRAALRKLWASDPVITTHDGLTDYAEDYSFDPAAAAAVRTIWKAGNAVADYLENTAAAQQPETEAAAGDTEADPADQPT